VNATDGLKGSQVGTLVDALIDAYTPDDLEILLYIKLGRSFRDIAAGNSFRARVFNLVRAADSEGWLPDLIAAAGEDRPGNVQLSRWITANGQGVGPAVAARPTHVLLRYVSMNFDLIELRRIVLRTIKQPVSPIVGFVVRYPDDVFVAKLCDWLESNLSNTRRKDAVNLYSDFGPVDAGIRAVARYRRDLDSADVLCKVYAQGVSAEVIAEFWAGINREFPQISRRLVLVFICESSAQLPTDVIELPLPRFEITDIDIWTRDIVRMYGWPVELADEWTAWLCDESMYDDVLDVRGLYETMDDHIQQVLYEPHSFRQRLEGRAGYANAPHT
jgi:hypothetical protein